MKLEAATKRQLEEMMGWFSNRESCSNWSGPEFRFPFTQSTFLEDICWKELPSYSLVKEGGRLVGFGQYYLREGRCHLARLVISPRYRNQGLGRLLVVRLAELGCKELGVTECSLFVLESNKAASCCYRNAGFEPAVYPGEMPELEGCLYMVKRSAI
jgi:ribosomal protein S18 acetylase RimI-like enzyme